MDIPANNLSTAKHRDTLTAQLLEVSNWAERSDKILSGEVSLTVDEIERHIKTGNLNSNASEFE